MDSALTHTSKFSLCLNFGQDNLNTFTLYQTYNKYIHFICNLQRTRYKYNICTCIFSSCKTQQKVFHSLLFFQGTVLEDQILVHLPHLLKLRLLCPSQQTELTQQLCKKTQHQGTKVYLKCCYNRHCISSTCYCKLYDEIKGFGNYCTNFTYPESTKH